VLGRSLQAALLLGLWFALWGQLSWANLLSGVVVVPLTLALLRPPVRSHRVRPVALARFAVTFLGLLVRSSWTVAVAVLRPTPGRLRTGVVTCPLTQPDPLVATVVADAITLTPGTLTLDVRADPPAVEVHVLGLGDPDEVRAGVAELERLVLRALEPVGGPTEGTSRPTGGAR
jgi:multicomponent Na+:H+ antiporter subunit E